MNEQAIKKNRPEGWRQGIKPNNKKTYTTDDLNFMYEEGADNLIAAGYRLPEQPDKREIEKKRIKDFGRRLIELGYELSEEDFDRAFIAFKELVDIKKQAGYHLDPEQAEMVKKIKRLKEELEGWIVFRGDMKMEKGEAPVVAIDSDFWDVWCKDMDKALTRIPEQTDLTQKPPKKL